MSDTAALVVDGTQVRFETGEGNMVRVLAGEEDIGSLESAGEGSDYAARRPDGEALTRASQWGGRVTARFGSKELAVRALLELRVGARKKSPTVREPDTLPPSTHSEKERS